MPRISLAKYKEVPSLSEETIAFSCDVLLDGAKICTASNDGHGGSNRYFPVTVLTQHDAVIRADLAERGETAGVEALDALISAIGADKVLTAQAKKMAKNGGAFSVFFFDQSPSGWRMRGRFVGTPTRERVPAIVAEEMPDAYRVFTADGPETLAPIPRAPVQ